MGLVGSIADAFLMRQRFTLETSLSVDDLVKRLRIRLPKARNYHTTVVWDDNDFCTRRTINRDGFTIAWVRPYWGHFVYAKGTFESMAEGTRLHVCMAPRPILRYAFWFFVVIGAVSLPIALLDSPEDMYAGLGGFAFITAFPWLFGMGDVCMHRRRIRKLFGEAIE